MLFPTCITAASVQRIPFPSGRTPSLNPPFTPALKVGVSRGGFTWKLSRLLVRPKRPAVVHQGTSCSNGGSGGWVAGGFHGSTDQHDRGPRWTLDGIAILVSAKTFVWLFPGFANAKANNPDGAPKTTTIIVPVLNEELCIESIINYINRLNPRPTEIIVVDGGSTDRTVKLARELGAKVLRSGKGRAKQMNLGASKAKGHHLVFLHADTEPPEDLVEVVDKVLQNPKVVLGGFLSHVDYNGNLLPLSTLNSCLKTWYLPLVLRPLSFARGLRALFGDQALFMRKSDFDSVGGYNEEIPIMEDMDLCIRLHMNGRAGGDEQLKGRGQIRTVLNKVARTSGRRIVNWGAWRAMFIYNVVGLNWYFGASPERQWELYNKLYGDSYRS